MLSQIATKAEIDVNYFKFIQAECNKQMNGHRAYNRVRCITAVEVYSSLVNQDHDTGIEDRVIARGINILNVLTQSRTTILL